MTDQIMETLTNEEHERLLLMSEHAIAPPLSPAAQAVLDAWNNEWSKGSFCHDQRSIAAALRAAGTYLQNAYANEEPMDHADDFLLDLANELEQTND